MYRNKLSFCHLITREYKMNNQLFYNYITYYQDRIGNITLYCKGIEKE